MKIQLEDHFYTFFFFKIVPWRSLHIIRSAIPFYEWLYKFCFFEGPNIIYSLAYRMLLCFDIKENGIIGILIISNKCSK